MCDRHAIRFVDGSGNRSAFLVSEWGGREFVRDAVQFVDGWNREGSLPMDAGVLMVGFVRLTGRLGYESDGLQLLSEFPNSEVWEILGAPNAPAKAVCVE